jgi:PAS domain S-box-containing protein
MKKYFYISVSVMNKAQFVTIFFDITERKKSEEALRSSEERFKRLVKSVTDYIYTVKVEDGYPVATLHDPGCIAATGYSSEEYGADPGLWYRIVHEEDRQAVIDQTIRVATGEEALSLEHRIIHKDGTVRWVKNTPAPQYDQEGHLIAYDGLIEDITERKKAEEALYISEERFKTEYQGNPIPSFTWQKKGDDFVLINFNVAAKTLMGKDIAKHLGKTVCEVFPDESISDELLQCYTEKGIVKKEGHTQLLAGKILMVTHAFVPPDFVIAHIEDITKRKEAEQKLLESEERYRTAVEYSNDGISLVKDGKHIYINKKFVDIFGYDAPEDFIEKPTHLVVHPDNHGEQKEYRQRRERGEAAPERFEFKGVKKDGTEIFVEASVTKTVYRGGTGFICLFKRHNGTQKSGRSAEKKRSNLEVCLLGLPCRYSLSHIRTGNQMDE